MELWLVMKIFSLCQEILKVEKLVNRTITIRKLLTLFEIFFLFVLWNKDYRNFVITRSFKPPYSFILKETYGRIMKENNWSSEDSKLIFCFCLFFVLNIVFSVLKFCNSYKHLPWMSKKGSRGKRFKKRRFMWQW